MLTIYRRHRVRCKSSGRRAKCSCPIWVQGVLDDVAIRQSLDVTGWEAAQKRVREMEAVGIKNLIPLSEAYARFIAQHEASGAAKATTQKHRLLQRELIDFFGDSPVRTLSVDDIAKFRESWTVGQQTATYKIGRLRQFFKFAIERGWIEKNPATYLKLPKIHEIKVKPFTPQEVEKIVNAIDDFPAWGIYGTGNRDRLRAFISVLRWTGMRIGDVVQLNRSKIINGQIILRTEKNGKRVSIPAHKEILENLEKMPGEFYFWSGEGSVHSAVTCWWRTLKRLGTVAGVHIHAHRFRHSLAANLISKGIPIAQVAAILGNTPSMVERTYAQFIEQRQIAINEAMKSVWS